MRRALIAALVALIALAAAHTALGARPAYRIPADEFPASWRVARTQLERALVRAPRGSETHADIRWVLRLGSLYMGSGQPAGRRRTVSRTMRVNAWWFTRWSAPPDRIIVRDPTGVLSTYWKGRGLAVNPVATSGRWQGLNDDLSGVRLADALLPFAVERKAGGTRFLLWEYYDVPERPGAIRPGASGMAQGRLVHLLANAYYLTGEHRFSDAARGALAAFGVSVARGGVVSRVWVRGERRSRPWYVERAYPGGSPWQGAALNGFMVTLLNLRSSADLLRSEPKPLPTGPAELRRRPRAPGALDAARISRALSIRGEKTLRHYLPLHDTGRWSLYMLYRPGFAWRSYLADRTYHCYHVALLRQLAHDAPAGGARTYRAYAARWAGYARRAGVTCR